MTEMPGEIATFLDATDAFFYGLGGGFCAELIGWHKLRTTIIQTRLLWGVCTNGRG